jgi:hypothetical protein
MMKRLRVYKGEARKSVGKAKAPAAAKTAAEPAE